MPVEIPRPAWAYGRWSWPWPPAVQGTVWAERLNQASADVVSSTVAWAQRSAIEWWQQTAIARELDALPPGVMSGLASITSYPMRFAAAQSSEALAADVLDMIGDILELTRSVSSVPIVGWVLGIVQMGVQAAVGVLRGLEPVEVLREPARYDPDAAVYWQARVMDLAIADPERVFLPGGWGRILSVRVRRPDYGGHNREWIQEVEGDGIGYVPAQAVNRGSLDVLMRLWFVRSDASPESIYEGRVTGAMPAWVQPGTISACNTVWQRCLSPPGCYDVHVPRIVGEWQRWVDEIMAMRAAKRDAGVRARMFVGCSPWGAKIANTGNVAIYKGKVYARASAADIWRVAGAIIERQQRRGVWTVAGAAYSSERQRAFRANPELRALLSAARMRLLAHPAVMSVRPGAVPDRDYRRAVEYVQRRRAWGPVGLTGRRVKKDPLRQWTGTIPKK